MTDLENYRCPALQKNGEVCCRQIKKISFPYCGVHCKQVLTKGSTEVEKAKQLAESLKSKVIVKEEAPKESKEFKKIFELLKEAKESVVNEFKELRKEFFTHERRIVKEIIFLHPVVYYMDAAKQRQKDFLIKKRSLNMEKRKALMPPGVKN
jgi:hypothetical protein